MTVTYQLEHVRDLWDEVEDLLRAHYHEVAHYQDIPLAPDYRSYEALEDAGILKCFTARLDRKLVGYGVFMVKHNLHYSTSKQAVQDILFVLPEYRKGRIGFNLIKYCDEQLAQLGAEVVYHHVKAKESLDFSPLLEHLGYELIDKIYGRRL